MSPPPMAVPDTIEAELLFYFGGFYMTNRFWYSTFNPPFTFGDDLLVAAGLGTWCINWYLPCLGSDVSLVRSRARDLSAGVGPWVDVPYFGYVGTYPDVAMSANVCIRVRDTKRVAASRQHAYTCVPGIPRAAIVENQITSAYQTLLRQAYQEVYEFSTLLGAERAVVSYREGNAWRSVGHVQFWGGLQVSLDVAPRRHRLKNTAFIP